jgi:hypothetical protein
VCRRCAIPQDSPLSKWLSLPPALDLRYLSKVVFYNRYVKVWCKVAKLPRIRTMFSSDSARQFFCPGCIQNTHRKIQNISCARLEWLYSTHFPPALPFLFSTILHIHISPKSKMDMDDVGWISCCAQPKICVHRVHAWTMLRKQNINSKSTRKRRSSLCSAVGFMSKLNACEFTCIGNQKSPHACS